MASIEAGLGGAQLSENPHCHCCDGSPKNTLYCPLKGVSTDLRIRRPPEAGDLEEQLYITFDTLEGYRFELVRVKPHLNGPRLVAGQLPLKIDCNPTVA